ncbi:MAG: GNAT family N-acetyltransferase [Flavobacteriales bacterium]|nr:GNAT family N-acetyltransferase [Flavobacteriales bacterium]
MINVEVNPDLTLIRWDSVSELFQLVNWGMRSQYEVENSFRKSSVTCFVKKGNQIIGFGRTVDDGKYYALLVDIVVHPDYQFQGIGRTIVNELQSRLLGYDFVTLTAAPDKEAFYQKLGWKKQNSAFIFPKDERQIIDHCEYNCRKQ